MSIDHGADELSLKIMKILDNNIDTDWIWNGDDEIKQETIDTYTATKQLIKLFSEEMI